MKKTRFYLVIILMAVIGFFVFSNDLVNATIDNFTVVSEKVSVENDLNYPFEDTVKDEENVIKSTNIETESVSSLIVKFTGAGEVSFDYMIYSQSGSDILEILVNDEKIVSRSGSTSWNTFIWYSDDASLETVITIKYIEDYDNYEDCCYLKNLNFDGLRYTPLLQLELDNNTYTQPNEFIYYSDSTNEGVLYLSSNDSNYLINEYEIQVKLNGNKVDGEAYAYNLKNNLIDVNKVEISYAYGEYRERNLSFYYLVSLDEVVGEGITSYENDINNPFILKEEDSEFVISSTNTGLGTTSTINFVFVGNGMVSFDYFVSGVADVDYLRVFLDSSEKTIVTGVSESFEKIEHSFYGSSTDVHVLTVEYVRGQESVDVTGGNLVYIKNLDFTVYNDVETPSIYFDGYLVNDNDKICVENGSYLIAIDNLGEGVQVEVYVNDVLVDVNGDGTYTVIVENNTNNIFVYVSKESSVGQSISFFVASKITDTVFGIENDSNNPFVRTVFNDEIVIKTNVEGVNDVETSISYIASRRIKVTIQYLVSTEVNDYFIIKINEEEVLKQSGIDDSWVTVEYELFNGDVMVLSYVKDSFNHGGDDAVYFNSITFVEQNYAEIQGGTINGVDFNESTSIIYFDWENHNSVISFVNFNESLSVSVSLNGVIIEGTNGIYDINAKVKFNNIIRIVYSGENLLDSVITFGYNVKLIKNELISYDEKINYELKEIEEKIVVGLNSTNVFQEAKLVLRVIGEGYFKFDYKYYIENNSSIKICFDNECNSLVSGEIVDWTTIGYDFLTKEEHTVSIIVNSNYYNFDTDYLYLNNFEFYSHASIVGLLSGDGSASNPYNYQAIISKMDEIGLNSFAMNIYNLDLAVETIYNVNLDGYSFTMNDNEVTGNENVVAALNAIGVSHLNVTNEIINLNVYFYNEGLNNVITEGYGTEENPYQINDVNQLKEISNGLEYCYILNENINLNGIEWIPLGNEDTPFVGCLNGNNKVISGLTITEGEMGGLFGIAIGAKVINLTIENASISNVVYAGTLFAGAENVHVENVKIVNVAIDIENDSRVMAGSLIAMAVNSSLTDIEASGTINVLSEHQNYIGGLVGCIAEGKIASVLSTVDVSGRGLLGGLIGLSSSDIVDISNVTIFGNIVGITDNLDTYFGAVSANHDVNLSNVTHKISGTYTSNDFTINEAKIYGIGLDKNGFLLTLVDGEFEANVILSNIDDVYNGAKASVNGYVIRFVMSDGTYRYYELFDFDNRTIISKNINIDVDSLNVYSNNFDQMTIEKSNYYGNEDNDISVYNSIQINTLEDFLHMTYIVNYGIPVSFGEIYTYGVYNTTLSFELNTNLSFIDVDYKGLGNSYAYPYLGSIEGNNNYLEFGITNDTSLISAFINFYSNLDCVPVIQNLIIKGKIAGEGFVGLVGYYMGTGTVKFINILSYANFSGTNSGSLLARSDDRGIIYVENCVNYASFSSTVFIGENNNSTIEYSGLNKNYGEYLGEENKNINSLFFGSSSVYSNDEDADLENYYILNVGDSGVTITIDFDGTSVKNLTDEVGVEYTSDEDGFVTFKMNNSNLYSVYIYAALLKEKLYTLNTSFRGTLTVPKIIIVDDTSVLHSDGTNNWKLKATVEMYGGSEFSIEVSADLTKEDLNSYELVFENVGLIHDDYIINQTITRLTRTIDLMIEYKDVYNNIINGDYKENALLAKNKLNTLNSIYVEDSVSVESISVYNNYINDNNIGLEELNKWFAAIVDDVSLVDSVPSVIYGEELSLEVLVEFLDGSSKVEMIEFDYSLEDISGNVVKITSLDNYISEKGTIKVYDEKLVFDILFIKKTISVSVENYSFEYTGNVHFLVIDFDLGDNKFNDSIADVVLEYTNSLSEACEPLNVGTYNVSIVSYNLSNSDYYELESLVPNPLVITPKEVDIVWEGTYESDYDGTDKISTIKAYYTNIEEEKVYVDIIDTTLVNAGTYDLGLSFGDNNYIASDLTLVKKYVINKLNVQLSIGDYSINYGDFVPEIEVVITGTILEDDKNDSYFSIVKNDVYYHSSYNLDSGIYSLVPSLNNEAEMALNYNIIKVNGTLNVVGIDTRVVSEDITFEYVSAGFDMIIRNVMVYDVNDSVIFYDELKYEFSKDSEIVDEVVDVGTYSVKIIFEGDGNYNPSSTTIDLVITPRIVYAEWNDRDFDSIYDGTNKLDSIEVKYMDENLEYVEASLNIDSMINAGEYTLIASAINDNYQVAEQTKSRNYTIDKIDVSLEIGEYEIDYQQSLSIIEVNVEGLLDTDNEGASYNILKNEVLQDSSSVLECGEYTLVPVLNNESKISINYNIIKTNGTLSIVGVDTKIVYPDTINYEYNGEKFILDLSEVEVYDLNDNKVENPEISYEIKQFDEVVEEAINVGEYVINLVSAGTRNYSSCEKQVILIIIPKEVDIVWEGIYESDYDGTNKISTIKAYYTNIIEEKVYVDIADITLINSGTYYLSVMFDDYNYVISEETLNKQYVINKLDVQLSIGDYSINFGDSLPTISIDVTGTILPGDRESAYYGIVRNDMNYEASYDLDCGVYILIPYLTNEDELSNNYNISKINGTLDVVGNATTVVFEGDFAHIYNGEKFIPDLKGTKVYDSNSIEIDNPSITYAIRKDGNVVDEAVNVGSYVVEIIFSGQGGNSSSRTFVDLTISPSSVVVQIDDASEEYGSPVSFLTYQIKEGNVYNHEDLEIVLTKETGNDIGVYSITGVSNNKNYDVEFINGSYEIIKRNILIKINDKSSDYLEEISELTYEIANGSIVNDDDLGIVLTKEEGNNAGIYLIEGTYNHDNYQVSFIPGIYTINKIDIENIIFEDVNTVYDGENVDFGISSSTLSDGSNASVIYLLESGEVITNIINAGTYVVQAHLSNKNYNDLVITANVVVEKAVTNLGYSVSSVEVEYDENGYDYRLDNIIFEDGRIADVEYYILENGQVVGSIIDIGEYIVVVNIKDDLGNYRSNTSSQNIHIKHKNITIAYSTETLVYNGEGQYPTFDNEELFVKSFNTTDGLVPVNVGSYTMNVAPINSNYVITNNTINYNIEALAVEFNDAQYYEYNNEVIQINVVITNKIGDDDVSLNVEYYINNDKVTEIKDAGNYIIKAISLNGSRASNYKIDNDEFVLTVNPKKIVVKPSNTNKVYGSSDPVMEYTLSEELYDNLQVTGNLVREEGENAGVYLISAENLVVPLNYELEIHGAYRYFTIIPKRVQIDYEDTVFEYDGTEKRLEIEVSEGATVEYEGDMINVGSYTVKVVLINDNYSLPDGYEDIIVIINKRNISSLIAVDQTEFQYTGSKVIPNVSCGDYDCVITYTKDSVTVSEMVNPGTYKLLVLIENETELGEKTYTIKINKMESSPKQVSLEIHYNRIIVTKDDSLEYKIDNGDYYSNNEFNGLIASHKYTISVRRKETALAYASSPIVYEVVTTDNPTVIHGLIDRLSNEINEENLKILKDISVKMKNVNQLDIDVNKYAKYNEIKRNFEAAINSYEVNVDNSNKVSNFLEGKIMLINLVISLVAFVVVRRRINYV